METVLHDERFLQPLLFFFIIMMCAPFLFRTLKAPFFILNAPKVTGLGAPTWASTTGQ